MPKTLNNKQIFDFVYHLSDTAKKEKWISRYDIETDEFAYTKPELSSDARIKYVNDEVALYTTKDNEIEGIFIEYFTKNFVKHQKDLKSFKESLQELTKEAEKKEQVIIEIKQRKPSNLLAKELEKAVKSSLFEDMVIQK